MTNRVPPELRAIRGTRQRDRAATPAEATLLPKVTTPPAPPAWLSGEAVAEWYRAARTLAACGLLREGALATLGHYCALHGALVDAWQRGTVPPAAHLAALRGFAASLGLVLPPASRSPEPQRANPFAKFKRLSGA